MNDSRTLSTFRFHLLLTAAAVVLSFAALASLLIFVPLISDFDRAAPGSVQQGGLANYVLFLHESFWPVVAGSVLASIASGMVLFERMTAPLRRFRSVYLQISDGTIPAPLRIRALDYLRDEAADLNRMLESLGATRTSAQRDLAAIREGLQEIVACELPAESEEVIAQVRAALSRLDPGPE